MLRPSSARPLFLEVWRILAQNSDLSAMSLLNPAATVRMDSCDGKTAADVGWLHLWSAGALCDGACILARNPFPQNLTAGLSGSVSEIFFKRAVVFLVCKNGIQNRYFRENASRKKPDQRGGFQESQSGMRLAQHLSEGVILVSEID